VEAVAEQTQTPADLAGMMGLAVLATAAQKRAQVEARPGWFEPLNLFICVALPPGNKKSAVVKLATKPLVDWQKDEAERIRPLQAVARARQKVLSVALNDAVKKAAKAPDDPTLCEKVARLELELERAVIPPTPRLFGDDETQEALQAALCQQGGRFAILSAEGAIFQIMAGRYSAGANVEVYLQAHAGDRIEVGRKGQATISAESPALTVGVCVQPDVIRALSRTPQFRGRGLLGRFLFAMPKSTVGRRAWDAGPVPDDVRDGWHATVGGLLALEASERTLWLAPEASADLAAFFEEIEPRRGEDGALALIADWAAKGEGAAVRLAGLLALVRDPLTRAVDPDSMAGGIALVRYLIPHAEAAFAQMGASPASARAEALLMHLRRWDEQVETTPERPKHFSKLRFKIRRRPDGVRETTASAILTDGPRGEAEGFETVEQVTEALELLRDHGFARGPIEPPRSGKAGRPSAPWWEFNPAAFGVSTDCAESTEGS